MKTKLVVALVALALSQASMGGDKENDLIDRVVAAYGGDRISNLQSFTMTKKFLSPSLGQSHTSELEHVGSMTQHIAVDKQSGKALFESLFSGRSGDFQNATVTDGEVAHVINFQAGTFGTAPQADIYTFGGGSMRTNDAVLAHELSKARETAEYRGEVSYLNRPHETIEMPFPASPSLTLFVDKENHRITRMLRTNSQLGNLDYVFARWKEDNGVPYASSVNFFVAGKPNLISVHNVSTFNRELDQSMFDVPDNLEREGERIDTSEMAGTRLSDSVYHAGQGGTFSAFIDSPAGLVAVGGGGGFAQRLAYFREQTGNYQPLAYQVVTHHHSDHLAGIRDAVEAGATLVAVDSHVNDIKSFGGVDNPDLQLVRGRLTLGSGDDRVEIYEVSTIHSARFLVTYVPSTKVIFIADHMNSPYKTGVPLANPNTVDMWSELQRIGIDFNKIMVSHGARVFTRNDMRRSVEAFAGPPTCQANRPVCL